MSLSPGSSTRQAQNNVISNIVMGFLSAATPCLNWAIGSTQWTNPIVPKILKYIIKIIENATLQIFLLAQSHIPANQHQFWDDIFIFVSSENWCLLAGNFFSGSKIIWQSGIFFISFMIYIWAQSVGSLIWT